MTTKMISFADAIKYKPEPEHADRTARRPVGNRYEIKRFRTREAMARAIRKQQQSAGICGKIRACEVWHPFVALGATEGY